MLHLLFRLIRGTVNLTFFCGCAELVLQIFNFAASPPLKDKFQRAVDRLTLRLADITYRDILAYFRRTLVLKSVAWLFVCVNLSLWFWRAYSTAQLEGWSGRTLGLELVAFRSWCILGFTFYSYFVIPAVLAKILQDDKVCQSIEPLFIMSSGCLSSWIVILMAFLGMMSLAGRFLHGRSVTVAYEVIFLIWVVVGGLVGQFCICFLALLLVLSAVRVCRVFLWIVTESLFRIATSRKGAFAAFVFLLTLLFGVVKLLVLS